MSGVIMPQQKQGLSKSLLPIAGQAVGAVYGGPAGAAVGGMVGQKLAGGDKQVTPVQSQAPAMQRRLDAAQPDPMQDLSAADQALGQLPPELQKEYRPVLQTAMQRAQYSRGMA